MPTSYASHRKQTQILMFLFVFCAGVTLSGRLAHAQVSQWLNPDGGLYEIAGNWSVGGVPGPNSTVIFGLPNQYDVEFLNDQTAAELTIANNSQVTFRVSGFETMDRSYAIAGNASIENAALTLDGLIGVGNLDLSVDDTLNVIVSELNVFNGAQLSSGPTVMDGNSNGNRTLTEVSGADEAGEPSRLETSSLIVGQNWRANVKVEDGGQVASDFAWLGANYSGIGQHEGEVFVRGTGADGSPSTWITNGRLEIGGGGRGLFEVIDGAFASSVSARILASSEATVSGEDATGNPSRWNTGELTIRRGGLDIEDGAVVFSEDVFLNRFGTASVNGTGASNDPSTWNISGLFRIGNDEQAFMEINHGAHVLSETTEIAEDTSNGDSAVSIAGSDDGVVSKWINSGDLFLGGSQTAEGGAARIRLHDALSHLEVGGTLKIWGPGEVRMTDGYLSADVVDNAEGGLFDFQAGTLRVNQFNGDLFNPAGRLSPGPDAGATAIIGDYTQQADATLALDIGGTNGGSTHDLVTVAGDAVIDGQLELALTGNFTPAVSDQFIVFSADSLNGFFDNVTTGQRLDTTDGGGSFIVNYGIGSPFDENRIVLSDFLALSIDVDFNGDGVADCADVDALVADIAAGSNTALYDLTGDGAVDQADLTEWLAGAGALNLPSGNSYLEGDANLDGFVDGLDFIAWNANKFTSTAAWCSGDFTADGFVDGLDFIVWNANKFTSADAQMSAVPEPSSGILVCVLVVFTLCSSRQKHAFGQDR